MATRDYVADGIVVHWDSDRCIHSENCTRGLPEVFDRSARPWVDVQAAPAERIAAVIDTCPSGALSYTRTDGTATDRPGPAQSVAISAPSVTAVTITPLANGPLSVVGPVTVQLPDGEVEQVERIQLCRCGHSAAKPRCDGSHVRVGFTAPGAET